MIYELRTTTVRPGSVGAFEQLLEQALPVRQQYARLAGCWHTEVGKLLQVVELWPYDDARQRAEANAAAARDGGLSYLASDLVVASSVEQLQPAPYMRPLDGSPQQVGPLFELRIYQLKSGQVPAMIDLWTTKIAAREELSPLLGCWSTEAGKWYHLWPYPSFESRGSVRTEAQRRGIWPPNTVPLLVAQANQLMLPASFSPIK